MQKIQLLCVMEVRTPCPTTPQSHTNRFASSHKRSFKTEGQIMPVTYVQGSFPRSPRFAPSGLLTSFDEKLIHFYCLCTTCQAARDPAGAALITLTRGSSVARLVTDLWPKHTWKAWKLLPHWAVYMPCFKNNVIYYIFYIWITTAPHQLHRQHCRSQGRSCVRRTCCHLVWLVSSS